MTDTAWAEPAEPVESAVSNLLSFQSCEPPALTAREKAPPAYGPPSKTATHTYLLQVQGHAMAQVLEAVVPALDRLLAEKMADVRDRKVEELVDFITGQLVVPSALDTQMARRLAARQARVLNEFGFASAEELADANHSRAANRHALSDNWKARGQVFSVRHRSAAGPTHEVFPLFQFEEHRPIKAVQAVLQAFGPHKAPWKLALWFCSNNGWLAGQARPVDLLLSAPDAVLAAAERDAAESAA